MELVSLIELSLIKGIGKLTIKKLLEEYNSAEAILNLSYKELSEKFGKQIATLITEREKTLRKLAEKEIIKAEKLNIKIVSISNNSYPSLLKEIPDSPPYIYVKGRFPINEKSISIVGTRKVTSYGRFVTEKFSKELAKDSINIVSGLASGVDTIAHKSALSVDGETTAILGCGIDIVFPPENRKLYDELIEKGTVISEFPIGTKPTKHTFPQRNRLIAGLSYATVITEAPEKSGALITASFANDYGRLVFSVPCNINNPNCKGNNNLIKDGAFPLTDKDDIYSQIPFLKPREETENASAGQYELSKIEKKILSILTQPTHIDLIAEKTGINISELSIFLFDMEMRNIVKNENGFYFRVI